MRKSVPIAMPKDDYFSLIRNFALRKIRTDSEYTESLKMSGHLIGLDRRLTAGESAYLDALVILIREFEQAHRRVKLPSCGGIEVLRHLMAEHHMTQKQLARLIDVGESAASMILAGSRELTKSHIERLSRHFGVGVAVFFD
jgi:antitoxin component HigA of HigAB toxin-antitoxin module